jgi:hypothetical protein
MQVHQPAGATKAVKKNLLPRAANRKIQTKALHPAENNSGFNINNFNPLPTEGGFCFSV